MKNSSKDTNLDLSRSLCHHIVQTIFLDSLTRRIPATSLRPMAKREPTKFDPVVLNGMLEPLMVHLERMEHNKYDPVPIPALDAEGKVDPNGSPGHNWSRDAVAKLQWWLRDFYTGGGDYYCKVQDTKGTLMDWTFVIPPRETPIRQVPSMTPQLASLPSPLMAQALPAGQQLMAQAAQTLPPVVQPTQISQPIAPIPAPQSNMPAFNPWLNSAAALQQQQAQQQTQQIAQQQAQQLAQQQSQIQAAQQAMQAQQNQTLWYPPQGLQGAQMGQQPWQYQQNQPPAWYPPSQPTQPSVRQNLDDVYGVLPSRESFGSRLRGERDRDRDAEDRIKRDAEDKIKAMETLLQSERLERQKLEHLAQRERDQQEHARQLEALRMEIKSASDSGKKGEDDETRRLREQIEQNKADNERLKLEAMQQQMRTAQETMATQMRQQQEMMAAQMKATQDAMAKLFEGGGVKKEDERLKLLELELQREREDSRRRTEEANRIRDREREEADRTRDRERQERDMERVQREMKEQQTRFEMLVKEQATNRPDPILEVLRENQRTALEHQRQLADLQKSQIDKMAQFSMNPIELMRLMKDNNSGNDGVFRTLMASVGDIAGMYKNVAEHAIGLSGGGGGGSSIVPDMIRDGIGTAKEIMGQYFQSKATTEVAASKAKQAEAIAEAQKAAVQAQQQQTVNNQSATERARMEAIRAQQYVAAQKAQQEAQAQQAAGLAGAQAQEPAAAPAPTNGSNGSGGRQEAAPVPPVQVAAPAQPQPVPVPATTQPIPQAVPMASPPTTVADRKVYKKPTDAQLFGGIQPLIDAINHLRLGVKEGKVSAEEAVMGIMLGAAEVQKNNIDCAAFRIFNDECWADFMDIVLPDAPQNFKDECVERLAKLNGSEHKKPIDANEVVDAEDDGGNEDDGAAEDNQSAPAQA